MRNLKVNARRKPRENAHAGRLFQVINRSGSRSGRRGCHRPGLRPSQIGVEFARAEFTCSKGEAHIFLAGSFTLLGLASTYLDAPCHHAVVRLGVCRFVHIGMISTSARIAMARIEPV